MGNNDNVGVGVNVFVGMWALLFAVNGEAVCVCVFVCVGMTGYSQ